MDIGERQQGEILVLRPVGRIDNATSAAFQTRLLAAATSGATDVVVDFSAVDYISSAGLRALMAASKLKAKDRRIAVAALNQLVHEIFAISRFSHVVPIFATVEEAEAAWRSVPEPAASGAPAGHETGPPLQLKFWGTRGSLPAPLGPAAVRNKIREALIAARGRNLDTAESVDRFIDDSLPFALRGTFGGNTACMQIATGEEDYVLCDLGTGVREFGNRMLAQHGPGRKARYHIFLSHLHWDHIMGFPFFAPIYIPGNVVRIYGCHKVLRETIMRQHAYPSFPVEFRALGATIEFVELEPGQTYQVAGLSVSAIKQFHAGDSYGYRFVRDGKIVVYSTDCEHKYATLDESYPFVGFYRDADALIFDAMYSLADSISVKEDWGHSNNIAAVELAQIARVKRLVLFHHEPVFDDGMIAGILGETIRFEEISRDGHKVEVISAHDGLELTI